MNFIQKKQSIGLWNILRSKPTYVFKDLLNNQSYRCVSGIGENKSYPQLEFEVLIERRPVVGNYSYIIEPLVKLLNASIETGNPVIWT